LRGWGTEKVRDPALEQLKRYLSSFLLSQKRSARVEAETKDHLGKTSNYEYEVDASALEAEEGRGDRRNVQGELHPS
jgi:hypothetical protein